jgi:hypothetical protein
MPIFLGMGKALIALTFLAAATSGVPAATGAREVEYEITGTVHRANMTRKNADGSTAQIQVDVPYSDKFWAPPGTSLYLSVQKARITKKVDAINPYYILIDDGEEGTVHVLIRVGGKVLQEAEASAPYGIATASGVIPE